MLFLVHVSSSAISPLFPIRNWAVAWQKAAIVDKLEKFSGTRENAMESPRLQGKTYILGAADIHRSLLNGPEASPIGPLSNSQTDNEAATWPHPRDNGLTKANGRRHRR